MNRRMILHAAVAITIIIVGIGLSVFIVKTKPEVKKRRPEAYLPVVETLKIKTGKNRIVVDGYGDVGPLHKVDVIPQVSGKLTYVSPQMVKGGTFNKGDLLMRIDQRDYRLALMLSEAKLEDAKSTLLQTEELSKQARKEWYMTHTKEPPPLVAKEPQLEAARAALKAAQAGLDKAGLDLERTEIRADFSGMVINESVDKGQYVAPGKILATLYETSCAEISVPLEKEALGWIDVPGFTSEKGSPALVIADIAGIKTIWKGRVVRAEGMIDPKTRMVNVVVRVERPFSHKPPLSFGLFVKVLIQGHVLKRSALVPRSALHKGVVWVFQDGKLRFRRVKVARTVGDKVIISSGLKDGDNVIITHLDVVTDGMAVRVYNGA